MKNNNENIFKPNYLTFFTENVIVLFFISLILFAYYSKGNEWRLDTIIFFSIALCFLIWVLIVFLDVWVVKIAKKYVYIKRPWNKQWKELDITTFNKIKLKVNHDNYLIRHKQLVIYTEIGKKYKFRSDSSKIEEGLYAALLSQTPKLYAEYKTKIAEIQVEMQKNKKWDTFFLIVLILAFLLYVIIRKWILS